MRKGRCLESGLEQALKHALYAKTFKAYPTFTAIQLTLNFWARDIAWKVIRLEFCARDLAWKPAGTFAYKSPWSSPVLQNFWGFSPFFSFGSKKNLGEPTPSPLFWEPRTKVSPLENLEATASDLNRKSLSEVLDSLHRHCLWRVEFRSFEILF